MPDKLLYHAQAFGLRWAADTPLPLFSPAPEDERIADVTVERLPALPPRGGGEPVNSGELFADGIRFALDGAEYDMVDGKHIAWAGPGETAGPPVALYSTVTALLLAWRGGVPLHGSAVEVDGRAILICGEAGAGKSTLAAALTAHGGRLISDDLSLLAPCAAGETPMLRPGRSAIRLVDPLADDPLDKRLVQPVMTAQHEVPLTTLLLLRSRPIAPGTPDRVAALRRQLFRPTWMKRMPHRAERLATILNAVQELRIANFPSALETPAASADDRAAAALALMT